MIERAVPRESGEPCILTVNGGSSSIKLALLRARRPPERLASGRIERIGLPGATFTVKGTSAETPVARPIEAPDHGACVAPLVEWLEEAAGLEAVIAIGHRVVHGGPRFVRPERITAEVLEAIRRLAPFVPEHLPSEIALIEAFLGRLPGAVQVACFDTAFHRGMPPAARLLPIPRRYAALGVERYGFHGLSYEYLLEELARAAGREAAMGHVILAHLGNGASMAAVSGGRSIDTTMGFTPASGLPMSTRSGDLDPGLVAYLARTEGMTADGFHEMVNARSGLLGVSETSSDVRDLLAREGDDPRAAEAVGLFTYQARKWIGALAAALGGLDTLVFSGGIGENSPVIRGRICEGLEHLGIRLDGGRNAAGAAVISAEAARVAVRVIPTDEEIQIARAVLEVVGAPVSQKKGERMSNPRKGDGPAPPAARSRSKPQSGEEACIEDDRTSVSTEALRRAILDNLHYVQAKIPQIATRNDWYAAVAYTVRDRILRRWLCTVATLIREDVRAVAYLSAEFLLGPHLGNNLINLGIEDRVREAVKSLGFELDDLIAEEQEPGLGNGGLGRLAACFLDSLATLEIPAVGYGIRYEFGIFDQEIRDGWQAEITDKWLHLGNPWEIVRPELTYKVNLGGRTEAYRNEEGRHRVRWIPDKVVKGVAHDTPILGYRVHTANLLRLWSAEATESFDFQAFNVGDYYGAVDEKMGSESISKVLYPNDEPLQGKQLRLSQQYFFVSCALQDMLRMHLGLGRGRPDTFHERFAVQLNDTHPSIGVAELMRLLVDEHGIDWDTAWNVTRKTFSYTNHTLLPEALEKWSLSLLGGLLPRHLEIIFEINRRFLEEVRAERPGDDGLIARLSLIDEAGEKHVRMAHLATVGSHAVNGVAALHTDLLRRDVLHDFSDLYPDRFHNVTNGVTPRRWMVLANPKLAGLISRRIGEKWIVETERELRRLEPLAGDAGLQEEWRGIKLENKRALAAIIKERTGVAADPETLFDVQVKRIHEYKRQQLNVLHVVTLYDRLRRDPRADITPRTVIFGGKAAPGYFMAKLIIKLINSVAEVVNGDPAVGGRLKVVFLPDFNVKSSHHVYPAADLSEQISTAGKEASGTGNMKFAMNGALTIGTLDGANVEMREAVGAENFFLFGLETEEIKALRAKGYAPRERYESSADLKEAIDLIASGHFSRGDAGLFRPLVDSLLGWDEYMVLADYPSYIDCQDRAAAAYRDREKWARMSILNVARMGRFSSDRSIREYAERIWNARPVEVELDGE